MTDIFISYASQDRERIKLLAQALAEQGWSVWWDREIPFGRPFDEVIENALKSARCILVAWSKHAVTSGWVIEEAQYGRDRDILVPVLIDNVDIPFGFRRLQAAYLVDWDGNRTSPIFQQVLSAISSNIGTRPKKVNVNIRQQPSISRIKKFIQSRLGFVIVFPLAIVAIVAILFFGIFLFVWVRHILTGRPM